MEKQGTNGWLVILLIIFFPVVLVFAIPMFILGVLGEMKNSNPR